MIRLTTFILSLLTFCIANAQAPQEKSLLWQVTGNGIQQPSYLYGTIHVMCPGDVKMPAVVKEKFETTKELFLEIDMDDPNMMAEMMQAMQMNDTSTIKGMLGVETFKRIDTVFKSKTTISLELMNRAKPILLMSLIYPSLMGCQPQSWEKAFQDMAAAKKMDIKGLEKLADQVQVLDKIPYKVQADMFAEMLENLDSTRSTFTSMLNLYKEKDIDGMVKMTTADTRYGDLEKILLVDRNKKWIPVIGDQARQMPTFFAFGAGHLGGENGVINLLRQAGYTVTPIMYK